jgi:hypothetical protein
LLKVLFDREKIGEQGPFVVWGFRSAALNASPELFGTFLTGQYKKLEDGRNADIGLANSFWPAVQTLSDLGLVEMVGMLLDGDDADAEIIHPYSMRGGEPVERELALAAHHAASTMVTAGQRDWARKNNYVNLVPVRRHIVNAAMVEVYRLKYRPHTKATAAWYALMQNTTAEFLVEYQAMTKGGAATATSAA